MNKLRNKLRLKPIYIKVLIIILAIAAFAGVISALLNTYKEPIISIVEKMGIWAPLAIFAMRGVSIIFPAMPSSFFSLIAGNILGFKNGYITIICSDFIFCQAAFFIARFYGRAPVKRLVGAKAMKRIENFNQNQLEENFFLMTGLLMTGLFDFLSYSIGLGGTRWKIFTPALMISLLISDSILVAVGAELGGGNKIYLGLALLGAFALAIISGITNKKIKSKRNPS